MDDTTPAAPSFSEPVPSFPGATAPTVPRHLYVREGADFYPVTMNKIAADIGKRYLNDHEVGRPGRVLEILVITRTERYLTSLISCTHQALEDYGFSSYHCVADPSTPKRFEVEQTLSREKCLNYNVSDRLTGVVHKISFKFAPFVRQFLRGFAIDSVYFVLKDQPAEPTPATFREITKPLDDFFLGELRGGARFELVYVFRDEETRLMESRDFLLQKFADKT